MLYIYIYLYAISILIFYKYNCIWGRQGDKYYGGKRETGTKKNTAQNPQNVPAIFVKAHVPISFLHSCGQNCSLLFQPHCHHLKLKVKGIVDISKSLEMYPTFLPLMKLLP